MELTKTYSTSLQLLPHITSKMSRPPNQDRPSPLHGGELSSQRSHRPLLWYLEALPEQGPLSEADDVPRIQRACQLCSRRDNDDPEYHQGYWRGG